MKFFDAHTHLNHETLFMDWGNYLQDFAQAGGKALVNIGANADYNQHGIFIAQNAVKIAPEVWCKATVGTHPCDVGHHLESVEVEIEKLRNWAKSHPEEVVAIGECGIDLYYP